MQLEQLQTPSLIIRMDRVRGNVAVMRDRLRCRLERWRPHVKTAKIPQVLDELLRAGVRRFKCATTREAEVLLRRAEAPVDLLFAMALYGPNLARLEDLARAYPRHRISVLTEDAAHASQVRSGNAEVGLFVDLNPGCDRTGIPCGDRARIRSTVEAAGDSFRGLHDYEGHIRHEDRQLREEACAPIYRELVEISADLLAQGLVVPELITSGTPTFELALDDPCFAGHDHQVSPGTVVYWDGASVPYTELDFRPAATVLSRVISRPGPGRLTCDAGSKAIDAAVEDPCAEVAGYPGLLALRPSEEHLPIRVEEGPEPAMGSLVSLVPRHICPTVNLADEAVLLEEDEIVEIVPVAARGHETGVAGDSRKA